MAMRLAVAWAVSAMVASAAQAASSQTERILRWHSDITVHADGWLTVTETLQVRCNLEKIKRGIHRDFPVIYKEKDLLGRDRRFTAPFEVVRVERDGRPEAYHTTREGVNERVYMGRKNVFLKPGVYTYKLTYRVGRMIGFFEDHDELYFNLTGFEWAFPIETVSATVTLPEGIPAERIGHEAYTGAKGIKGRDYLSSVGGDNRVTFQASRPLNVHEDMTIVVTWPKGFIAEPTPAEKLKYFFLDEGMVMAALIGTGLVGVYFLVIWARVGRDPAKGIVIPLFEPPAPLDPAAVRYILRMGFDKICFAASVIGLAVKKQLTIDDDGDYSLAKVEGADESDLSRGEKKVAHRLLVHRGSIDLDRRNHSTFRSAIAGLKKVLADEYHGRYFHSNVKWFVPGVVVSVLTLGAVALMGFLVRGDPVVAFLCVWLAGWSFGVFFLVRQVIATWKRVAAGGSGLEKVGKRGGALFITLFAVPFCAAELVVLGVLVHMTSIWLLPILVLLGLINVRFHHLLKRPTVEGRKVMDQIEGFRTYLGTAEQDLLNAATPPQKTPELFEKCLPYALALGVENAWAEKFEDVLSRAAAGAEGGYRPYWYHGAAWSTLGAAAFTSSFSGSFSSALSSASSAPGSSSGAGGGGSSGGGGGGGGGGGW